MRLLDDLETSEQTREPGRRRFLASTAVASLGTAVLGSLAISLRYLRPSVLFELPSRFRAARLSELGRRPILFLRKRALYLVRDEGGVFACSAVCTHLGCLTRPNPNDDGFVCPCHGSQFALDGAVLKGPAPSALPHFRVEQRDEDLWVDVSRVEETDVRLEA